MRLISNLKRAKYIGAALVLLLAAMPVGPIATWIAGSNKASALTEAGEVEDCGELASALNTGGTVALGADISCTTWLLAPTTATLNLNNHNINFGGDYGLFAYNSGTTLTITGEGSINKTAGNTNPTIWPSYSAEIVIESGEINGKAYAAQVDAGGKLTINGGKLTADSWGVAAFEDSVVTLNNGKIISHSIGISGNGSAEYAGPIFNINGGMITADELGIYAPQINGVTTITNGTITGATGVEVRAGTLNISGGTITSTATTYNVVSNGNGGTTTGAAVAVAQHVTRQPLNVNISGGTFTGPVAFSQADPEAGDAVSENSVITGGTFVANNNYKSVEIEDRELLTVSGGTFSDLNIIPSEVAEGKAVYKIGDNYVVKNAPSLGTTPRKVLVKVGEPTALAGIADNTEFQESGVIVEATNGVTLDKTAGTVTAPVKGISNLKLGFEVYKLDNDTVVRDESFDKMIKIHAYKYNDLGTVYLDEAGDPFESNINVQLNTNIDSYELYTEDENVATIDQDGIITSVGAGETSVKLKVKIIETGEEVTETVGTVKVYSFEVESEVTVPVGAEISLTDGVISRVGNPGIVDVELDSASYATLSGTTAESTLKATEAGTATLTFKVDGEKIGTTTVKVYKAQKPDDIVLSVNGVGADEWQQFTLSGTNLPGYDLTIENRNIARAGVIRNNMFFGASCNTFSTTGGSEKCISATGAGKTKATVTYRDSMDTPTTQDFYVHVSRYTEDNGKPWYAFDGSFDYDVAQGDKVEFRLTEGYGQDSITLEDDQGLTVESDAGGNYTVTIPEDAEGGTYTLKFTDTVAGKKIAERTVTIRVHEIVTSEDELYVKRGNDNTQTIEAKEKNGYGNICSSVLFFELCNVEVRDANGRMSNGVTVEHTNGDSFKITVNRAGQYNVTFSDGSASKTVVVYGIDFTVTEQEYHIVKGDTAVDETKLVRALNRYWEETSNGTVTGFRILKESSTNYYVQWNGAEAGKYTVEFYAYAGPDRYDLQNREIRDTKTVDIYVYEMVTPDSAQYRGEIAKRLGETSYTFTGINVDDKINATVPGMAKITAEVTYGDAEAVDLTDIANGNVTISKPGRYQVTYTDTMNQGNGGIVGTWTAEFKVYGLDADAPKGEILNMTAGETYSYTINPAETYGLVRVTISKKGEHGKKTTVYQDETRYHGSGTASEDSAVKTFSFDPAEYGEGEYLVKIRNLSAEEYGEVEEGSFYVIAREYDFAMVEQGTPVEITSGSSWKVDEAYENGNKLTVDGKTVNLDTSELSLGVHTVILGHEFDGGPGGEDKFGVLKIVTVVVYKVVPAEDTTELNPGEVTVATVKDLYERVAKATTELIRDLVAAGVPEENIYCSPNNLIGDCYWSWGRLTFFDMLLEEHLTLDDIINEYGLTEEQAAMIDFGLIQEAVDKFKTAFGEEGWDETGLRTTALLNHANSGMFADEVGPLEIEVRVTDINDVIDEAEKAEFEQTLSDAGIDVDDIHYYDVSVLLKINGEELGRLHKLNGEITVALAKTSEPADGYTRQYFVIRKHGDGKPVVLTEGVDFYIKDGVIYVISDEFSTYAVAYKDTLIPKSPDTGEEVTAEAGAISVNLSLAIVIVLAIVMLGGAAVFAKRK